MESIRDWRSKVTVSYAHGAARWVCAGAVAVAVALSCASALALDVEVMNNNDAGAGSLREAIDMINASVDASNNITFNAAVTTITLASSLPPLNNNSTITIDGSGGTGTTIDGANVAQVFFVQTGSVLISNMAITNATATGGAGGNGAGGGGGGLGAGGAVYVNDAATVTIDTVTFTNNQATGGAGGDGSGTPADGGGGGGGTSGGSTVGDGGDGSATGGGGGGGGLGAPGSNGGAGTGGAGGGTGGDGGDSGANGNVGSNAFGAGGGGGDGNGNGGAGQFGAGGGGGGGAAGLGGAASFGGGDGGDSEDGGDGGDGLGGAVFVRQGGTLTIIDSDISGGGAAGGAGGTGSDENGTAGTGAGAGMYVHTGVNAELQVTGANTNTIDDSISGPGGITKTGTGTMVLSGINDYTGGTTVEDGTLQSGGAGALPSQVDPMENDAAYTVNGGVLDLNGNNLTMSSLQGTGGEIALNGAAELTVNNTNINTEYAGNITGDGKLIVDGVQFLTLSGTNTYTGDTEVQGGALFGTTDSLQGDILNDSELNFDQDFDGTYSGNISGTGNVTKSGPGEVTFDGNNTFTGELTVIAGKLIADSATAFPDVVFRINGGTLDLNGNDATTSGLIGNAAGTIELGTAILTADQTTTTTFAGIINGDGSLVKNGIGMLTLSGVNTFTGGVTVEDGILASGAVGAFPDDIPYVVNGGTLDLNDRNLTMASLNGTGGTVDLGSADLIVDTTTSDTYDGDIVGTGSLTKDGTGDLTLNGANTYSGGTTVEDGMLIQGADGALPGDTDYTVNGGTLDVGAFALTMSSLSGTGGTVNIDALLTVNQATDTTYEGEITGSGGLTKQGAGSLTLEGANTYTGDTTIETGGLIVNGSIDSNVTVQMDGTLAGSGMVNGDVDNAGTVIPGPAGTDTIGTFNVDGNYTHQSDANLEIGLNTNVDVLAVTGTADLQGGTVTVTPTASNFNIGLKYTFLTAGTVTGTFDTFEADFGNLEAIPEYESDQVSFTLLVNGMTFEQQGRTRNERAVGRYLDEIAPTATGDLQDVFTALSNLNPFEISQAEDELGGAVHGTLAQIGVQNTTLVIAQISQRLRSAAFSAGGMQGGSGEMPMYSHSRPDRKRDDLPIVLVSAGPDGGPLFDFDGGGGGSGTNWTPWAQGFGMGGKAASDGNADEVKYNMGGVVAGLERWLDHCWLLGYYGGYVGTQVATDDPNQNINGGQLGAYLYSDDGCNYTTLLGGFEFDGYKTHRHIEFDTIDRVASADASGWQGFGYAERGYAFRGCNNVVQPFIALQYIHLQRNDFTETGADSIDLAVDRMTTDSLRVMPGARLQYSFCTRNGLRFLPELHGAWVHEFLDTSTALNARFGPVGGAGFTVEGLDMGQNWALLGVNATWELHDGWSMFVNYDAMFNEPQELHLGSAGFGHVW